MDDAILDQLIKKHPEGSSAPLGNDLKLGVDTGQGVSKENVPAALGKFDVRVPGPLTYYPTLLFNPTSPPLPISHTCDISVTSLVPASPLGQHTMAYNGL